MFALEKWHQYAFGSQVTVYSDHKPLVNITKKRLDRAPKSLQGMLVQALAYEIKVHYQVFLADTLSRAYLLKTTDKDEEFEESGNAVTYLVIKNVVICYNKR